MLYETIWSLRESGELSLLKGCKLIGVSPQAIYQMRARQYQRTIQLRQIKDWVLEYRRLMPRIGGRKLYMLLKSRFIEYGIKLGRDGFFNYLKQNNLLVKLRRSYTKTTFSKHWLRKHQMRCIILV